MSMRIEIRNMNSCTVTTMIRSIPSRPVPFFFISGLPLAPAWPGFRVDGKMVDPSGRELQVPD